MTVRCSKVFGDFLFHPGHGQQAFRLDFQTVLRLVFNIKTETLLEIPTPD